MEKDRTDYVLTGDTWYPVDDKCEECGQQMWSNSRIHECTDWEHSDGCGNWYVVGEPVSDISVLQD